jgi:hypothetical protein
MKQIKLNKKLQILGAVALTAGLASPARAAINYQISDYSLEAVSLSDNGGVSYQPVLAGGIGITETGSSGLTGNAPSSYVAVCTDFNSALYVGDTYTYAAPVTTSLPPVGYPGNPVWTADGLLNAATLAVKFGSVLTSGNFDQAAGLQMAIWTVLYDSTGVGAVNTAGVFRAASGSAAYTDMNTFLAGLALATPSSAEILLPSPDDSSNGGILTNHGNNEPPQALMLVAPLVTPVPEASSIISGGMLLLSFGLCSLRTFSKFRA